MTAAQPRPIPIECGRPEGVGGDLYSGYRGGALIWHKVAIAFDKPESTSIKTGEAAQHVLAECWRKVGSRRSSSKPIWLQRSQCALQCVRRRSGLQHGDRLHTGDQIAMAADATNAYINARSEGKDVAILCDTWEVADAINQRLQDHFTNPDTASASVSREQQVRVGDLVLSRHNDASPPPDGRAGARERSRTKNYGYERELWTSSGYCRCTALVFHKLSLAKQRRSRGVSEFADGSARDLKP
jgi:hypothetical protein